MSNAWEELGRKVMQQLWEGYCEIDCADVQEWAEKAGLIEPVPYEPEQHGEGPADFDVEPGDTIYTYAAPYKTAADA